MHWVLFACLYLNKTLNRCFLFATSTVQSSKSFGTILFLYDPKHKLVDILVLKMSVTQGQTLLTSAGVFLTHFSFISGEIIQV